MKNASNNAERKPPSPARIAANRANAQKSSGPRTPEGKRRSSLNSLKLGPDTTRFLTLSDNPAVFRSLFDSYCRRFRPADPFEYNLVERMARAAWKLDFLAVIENEAIDAQDVTPCSFSNRPPQPLPPDEEERRKFSKYATSASCNEVHRQWVRWSREHDRAYKLLLDLRKNFPLPGEDDDALQPPTPVRQQKNAQTNPTLEPGRTAEPQQIQAHIATQPQSPAAKTNPTKPTAAASVHHPDDRNPQEFLAQFGYHNQTAGRDTGAGCGEAYHEAVSVVRGSILCGVARTTGGTLAGL
jgi:hypothetical protein